MLSTKNCSTGPSYSRSCDDTYNFNGQIIHDRKTGSLQRDANISRSQELHVEARNQREKRHELRTQQKCHLLISNREIDESLKDVSGREIVILLRACTENKNLEGGIRIHTQIARHGSFESSVFVVASLIHMYAKCGAVERAQDAFDKLGAPNLVTWNALITAYVQNGHYQKAIGRFDQMQSEGLRPDAVSFTCALKACGSVGALGKGRDIHFQVLKEHLLEKDVILAGALVDMYAKCGAIGEAQRVLEYTPLRNKVMWNSLITGYCHHGFGRDAIRCYEQMQLEGFVPDAVTYSSILRACGSIGELDMGIEIHAQMIKSSFLEDDIIVGNALVDMYAKCGALRKATEVFCELPVRDVIAWTALITGYGMHGKGEGALKLFEQMQQEGLSPNSVTYASILKACGNIGALKTCQEIHAQIVKECIYEGHIQVCTALLDVYVKCGMPEEAHSVFEKLPVHDIVSWAALMAGYAQTGEIEIVFHLFDTMLGEGINPNISIFTILLNICNHRGLLEKGQMYFQMMTEGYSMIPTLDHYTCMVNLYGRSGHLDKAARLIQKMQQRPDLQLWLTFLHACQKWQSVQFGTWAFDHAVQVGVANSAVYACMGNIYADAGRHDDAHRILSRSWHKQAS